MLSRDLPKPKGRKILNEWGGRDKGTTLVGNIVALGVWRHVILRGELVEGGSEKEAYQGG